MDEPLRRFWIALAAVWIILCCAAVLYSDQRGIPAAIGFAVVPAFLVEAAFYVASGVSATRQRLQNSGPMTKVAGLMTVSAVIPYCIYSIPTGVFEPLSLLWIGGLAGAASFWYVVFGRRQAADIGFLLLMSAVVLTKIFKPVYADPYPRLGLAILGALMWIRIGLLAILSIRRLEGVGFSFVPRLKDWRIGVLHYLYFLPVGLLIAIWLGFIRPEPAEISWRTGAVAIGTFVGILWVVALSEELFFRGFLQQWLRRRVAGEAVSIILVSTLFGLVHLGFGDFPNWRFAIIAGVASLFYGRAYAKAGSVCASMVTHALVVTTWRVFLRG